MRVIIPLVAVGALGIIGALGGYLIPGLFGVVVPYAALAVFLVGIIVNVLRWAKSPVPFRIPTTSGQQKSLPWIKQNKFDNPSTMVGLIGRMAAEVLVFRSLFKNTKMELGHDRNVTYGQEIFLWVAALAFHYSFLVIFLRHFRFFMEPVPFFSTMLAQVDGFFEITVPTVYLSGLVLLGALGYLFFRRIYYANLRYISLPADYFPLFLIMAIAVTGLSMRHLPWFKADLFVVKDLAVSIFSLSSPPVDALRNMQPMFFAHLFLVSSLIAYFPFSKLLHMPGIFMSPTRNLVNNSRVKRHINPWNPEVKTHTYEEWEDEFRDLMRDAGLPLEKDE